MNLTASKKDLVVALKRAASVADRKTTMPLLACAKLVASTGSLEVSATCLDVWIRGRCVADVSAPGSVAVSAKSLLARIESMPEGPVVLQVKGDHLAVSAPGSSRRFSLATMSADDWPVLAEPAADVGSVPGATVLSLFERASHAVAHDETRPHLASLLVERDGKHLRVVATDGHRLAKVEAPLKGPKAPPMLIPGRAVREVARVAQGAESIELVCVPPNAFFTVDGVTLGVRLVDATFPPYEQVIPKDSPSVVTAERQPLVEAIRAVALASNEKTGGVRLQMRPGAVRISAESQMGDGADEVAAEYSGAPAAVAAHAGYLLDALEAHGGQRVTIAFGGEVEPLVLRAAGFTAVVMPMRDL